MKRFALAVVVAAAGLMGSPASAAPSGPPPWSCVPRCDLPPTSDLPTSGEHCTPPLKPGGACASYGVGIGGTYVTTSGSFGVPGGFGWNGSAGAGMNFGACPANPCYGGLPFQGHDFDFNLGGFTGGASGWGDLAAGCLICYEEYHVGTATGEVVGRLCYNSRRIPPYYFC